MLKCHFVLHLLLMCLIYLYCFYIVGAVLYIMFGFTLSGAHKDVNDMLRYALFARSNRLLRSFHVCNVLFKLEKEYCGSF